MSGSEVQISHLEHRYGSQRIAEDFSLEIGSGEFVCLLGASGSGKSTILRLIAGFEKPTGGKVNVKTTGATSFVFQEPQLLPWRSVLKNVLLPLELKGEDQTAALKKAGEILDWVGLKEALPKFPHQLSGGMKMRVSLARALVSEPKLLLMDEPFSALDENTRHLLQEELREIWQKSKMTIVFVTHSISEAAFLSERAVLLKGDPMRVILDQSISYDPPRNSQIRMHPSYLEQVKNLTDQFTL